MGCVGLLWSVCLTGVGMRLCIRGIGGEDREWGVMEIRWSAID